jgi:Ni,Fe-hydrogenase III large subunit/Ni,Fe-hydrogenase III component G
MDAPSPGILVDHLVAAGAREVALRADGTVGCRFPRWEVPALADRLAELGFALELMAGTDTRPETGDYTLTYLFASPAPRRLVLVLVSVPPDAPHFPSLATRSFPASRFEREIHDLLGLTPTGHPELRRLALHQFWPEGYHPLRRDTVARRDFVDAGQPFPFRRVEGAGIFEITVGPVHAGIIEPGHFRFSVEGEEIVHLETRLGFVHKGIEKLFETLPFARAPELAERVSGDESVAHALAFAEALECLAGVSIPPRAAWLRLVLLELERLYNHAGDVGMIVNDTGFSWGHAHCFRLREELLRLNERLTGHRLLRGAIVPGGVAGPLAERGLADAAAVTGRVVGELLEVARICLDNSLVLERLQGTGRLTLKTAREMGVVGLVARASGLDGDLRRDAPTGAYREVTVVPAVYGQGDVWARTMVRLDEAREAARLLAVAAERLPAGPARVPLPALPAGGDAVACVEAWRGPVWYWVLAAGPETLRRVKVVDPSFRNWPALELAVLENIVPDFPLCNKSFNLSYSGSDL